MLADQRYNLFKNFFFYFCGEQYKRLVYRCIEVAHVDAKTIIVKNKTYDKTIYRQSSLIFVLSIRHVNELKSNLN